MSRELDCGDADAIRKVAAKFIADGDAARLRSRAVRRKKMSLSIPNRCRMMKN